MAKWYIEIMDVINIALCAMGLLGVVSSFMPVSRGVVEDVRDYSFGSLFVIEIMSTGELCRIEGLRGAYTLGDLVYLRRCHPVDPERLEYELRLGLVLFLMSFIGALIARWLDGTKRAKQY